MSDWEEDSKALLAESLSYLNEEVETAAAAEDLEEVVDVVECVDDGPSAVVPADDPEATENSSSFGDSFSGCSDDDRFPRDWSDAEVDSPFFGDSGASAAPDEFRRVFRRKNLTPRWRKFVRPLMWRCKWLELRMKQLHSQALRYEKELSAYNQEKLLWQLEMVASDKSAARSMPFTCPKRKKQAMKRQKRKRIEDTVDMLSYMSCHNIFSYYDKGFDAYGHCVNDGFDDHVEQNIRGDDDIGVNNEWSMFDFTDSDTSLEQILMEIDDVQSRILKLKTQLNKASCRNASDISTLGLILGDQPSFSAQSPSCSPGNNGVVLPGGALNATPPCMSEQDIEDLTMTETASYGDASPDIIESTVGLLSSAIDLSLDEHQIGDLGSGNADDILINNQAAEEELQNFEKVGRSIERPGGTVKEVEDKNIAPRVSGSETESETERVVVQQEPALKRCTKLETYVRRSKRGQVDRKISPGGRNG